ncbi:hypothetical protein [Bordetella tumbae]|uniref:hypothetical protein n=1 Tax=Bordetella tumbae TaxID=1649139 RepID=UPI0039EEE1BE
MSIARVVVASLMIGFAANVVAQEDPIFRVHIGAPPGYPAVCNRVDGHSNDYESDTRTVTIAQNWQCSPDSDCSTWRLRFQRVDDTNAHGGRCATRLSSTIKGDGVFSARLYIHSNIATSDGVYTINASPVPFESEEELDLIVANVEEGVAKFGMPGQAFAVPLAELQQRWIVVTMTKSGNSCNLLIAREDGAPSISKNNLYCNLNPTESRVVINSRARNHVSDTSSFMTISNVSWVPQ